ncbi:MAG: hypothetical protein JSV65_00365 [Armatimonadota bacterium]|nr:MAG: hypothetical protein JSV65_00365 [Armatimonadota bacterium]
MAALVLGSSMVDEWWYWRTHKAEHERILNRARIVHQLVDLAAEARDYSLAHESSEASIDELAKERPRASRILRTLRDYFGRDTEIRFTPPGASQRNWTSIEVSRYHAVLLEVSREGRVRVYEPGFPPDTSR